MPYRFEIDRREGLVRETWTGQFDVNELIQSCQDEWAHPDYQSGMCMLSDFRLAKGHLTVEDVLKFASWFGNNVPPQRLAIVVRRERAFDFAGMFAMIRESDQPRERQTRIFFSYAEAEAWVTDCKLVPPGAANDNRESALSA
jgi:hypothetical protein